MKNNEEQEEINIYKISVTQDKTSLVINKSSVVFGMEELKRKKVLKKELLTLLRLSLISQLQNDLNELRALLTEEKVTE